MQGTVRLVIGDIYDEDSGEDVLWDGGDVQRCQFEVGSQVQPPIREPLIQRMDRRNLCTQIRRACFDVCQDRRPTIPVNDEITKEGSFNAPESQYPNDLRIEASVTLFGFHIRWREMGDTSFEFFFRPGQWEMFGVSRGLKAKQLRAVAVSLIICPEPATTYFSRPWVL